VPAAASLSRAFHRALKGGVELDHWPVHRRPHTGVAAARPPGSAVAGPTRPRPHAGPHRAEPHNPLTGSRAAATSGSATCGSQGAGRSGSGFGVPVWLGYLKGKAYFYFLIRPKSGRWGSQRSCVAVAAAASRGAPGPDEVEAEDNGWGGSVACVGARGSDRRFNLAGDRLELRAHRGCP
jgi:hypothetical protein